VVYNPFLAFMITAITAAVLLTPLEQFSDGVVLIEAGVVSQAGSRSTLEIPRAVRVVDFGENILAPAYVDLHIHGAAGYDVMRASTDELAAIERLMADHGVTSYCPTTVTAPLDATMRALENLANAIEASKSISEGDVRAQPIGIHLEGPFISHAKRGVHPPADIREPSLELFKRFWDAARGHISLMTIAPELPGAIELITDAARLGVCVSLGHSNGEAEPARAAIAAGARHATHTFNAMRAFDHRDPGVLGTVLSDDRVTADIIADGVHLDPSVVDLFLKIKGPERAVLITDAISATGMPDGKYQLGSFEVEVRGPRCTLEGKLAGSVLTMDRAVRNVMDFSGCELATAVRLATSNPAKVLGNAKRKGMLAAGADADIVVLSPSGEVVETISRGRGI
jgi:N-acetylglucosamine-6-phosphate deacetylase